MTTDPLSAKTAARASVAAVQEKSGDLAVSWFVRKPELRDTPSKESVESGKRRVSTKSAVSGVGPLKEGALHVWKTPSAKFPLLLLPRGGNTAARCDAFSSILSASQLSRTNPGLRSPSSPTLRMSRKNPFVKTAPFFFML